MHLSGGDDAASALAPGVDAANERARVTASAYVSGASLIVLNAMPLLVGAVAERFHVGAVQLGYLTSAINLSTTAANLSAPAWVRRVPWPRTTLIATALSVAAIGVASVASSFTSALLLFMVLGGSLSLLGVPAFASLGDTQRPGRSYSVAMFVQMALASVWAVAVPALVTPRWGYPGAVLALAVVVIPCFWMANYIRAPSAQITTTEARPNGARPTPALLCGFAAFGLYIVGVTMFWYFVERLGTHLGIGRQWIGITVACASFSPVAGAAVGAYCSRRSNVLVVAILGNAVMVGAYAAIGAANDWVYLLSASAWGFGWAMSHPMFQAIIRRADSTNRLFTLAPAIMGLSGIVGGTVGGHVIGRLGYSQALVLSAIFAAAACALAFAAMRMTRREERPS